MLARQRLTLVRPDDPAWPPRRCSNGRLVVYPVVEVAQDVRRRRAAGRRPRAAGPGRPRRSRRRTSTTSSRSGCRPRTSSRAGLQARATVQVCSVPTRPSIVSVQLVGVEPWAWPRRSAPASRCRCRTWPGGSRRSRVASSSAAKTASHSRHRLTFRRWHRIRRSDVPAPVRPRRSPMASRRGRDARVRQMCRTQATPQAQTESTDDGDDAVEPPVIAGRDDDQDRSDRRAPDRASASGSG